VDRGIQTKVKSGDSKNAERRRIRKREAIGRQEGVGEGDKEMKEEGEEGRGESNEWNSFALFFPANGKDLFRTFLQMYLTQLRSSFTTVDCLRIKINLLPPWIVSELRSI
jgi:hypothetical protein